MGQRLSTQSYKGARDFYPADMQLENYIFDTWKRVCRSFGFEEYSFPILEPFEIFAAKTGQEIVNEQLYSFEDKGGRKLAIRPELTPGTVRMLAQKYKEIPQPIKWFMIGNNWRFEKPQTGRGREFYQLEANIFGVAGYEADVELFRLIIALMQAFGANEKMFTIKVSDRRLISSLFTDILKLPSESQPAVRRLMDKKDKMSPEDFEAGLTELGLTAEQIARITTFMSGTLETLEIPKTNVGYLTLVRIFDFFRTVGLADYLKFDPSIIRGFDYSDGLVYEVYNNNPANRRSLFGGERFDKLINIFGDYDLPSTGFAMGDYTLLEFLKGWRLLPEFSGCCDYLVTVWPSKSTEFMQKAMQISDVLRANGSTVSMWVGGSDKLEKQLKYANRMRVKYAVIIGPEEIQNNEYIVKDLKAGSSVRKRL